jgi:hypothetical protein
MPLLSFGGIPIITVHKNGLSKTGKIKGITFTIGKEKETCYENKWLS